MDIISAGDLLVTQHHLNICTFHKDIMFATATGAHVPPREKLLALNDVIIIRQLRGMYMVLEVLWNERKVFVSFVHDDIVKV